MDPSFTVHGSSPSIYEVDATSAGGFGAAIGVALGSVVTCRGGLSGELSVSSITSSLEPASLSEASELELCMMRRERAGLGFLAVLGVGGT